MTVRKRTRTELTALIRGRLLEAVEEECARRAVSDDHLIAQSEQDVVRELIILGLRYTKEHK